MWTTPRIWLRRRWYRSLLPIAVVGASAISVIERMLESFSVGEPSSLLIVSIGLLTGILLAFFGFTVGVIVTTQMSATVRAMLMLGFIAMSTVVIALLPTKANLGSLYLAEILFVFSGVQIAAPLSAWIHRDRGKIGFCGPLSRDTGYTNVASDFRFAIAFLVLLLVLINCHANWPSRAWDSRASFPILICSLLFGMASNLMLAESDRRGTVLSCSISVILLVAALSSYGSAEILTIKMRRVEIDRKFIALFGACVVTSWLTTTHILKRYLMRFGWGWRRRRHKLIAHRDGRMNLTATDRGIRLRQRRGWQSCAGILLIALLVSLPCGIVIEHLNEHPDQFDSYWFSLTTSNVQFAFMLFSLGYLFASLSLMAIVVTHHVQSLLRQSIVMAGLVLTASTLMEMVTGTTHELSDKDLIGAVGIAFVCLVELRLLAWTGRLLTRHTIGVTTIPKQVLTIRSIMSLTFLVGAAIVAADRLTNEFTTADATVTAVLATAMLWCHLMSILLIRQLVGRRTRAGVIAIAMMILTLVVTVTVVVAWSTPSPWYLGTLAISACLAGFWLPLWLASRWLRHNGWQQVAVG